MGDRVQAAIFIPTALASRANALPIHPKPTMPTILPASSSWYSAPELELMRQLPERNESWIGMRRWHQASIPSRTYSPIAASWP